MLVRRLRALPLSAPLLVAACTGVFFQPMRTQVLTPADIGLTYRDLWFDADDGMRLHGWLLTTSGPSRGLLLFLHGNAENISTHIASVAWLPAAGFAVLLFDYRGYGLSAGTPDLDGLHRDAEAALEAAFDQPEASPSGVAVFGQSLGGALAITALARSPQRHRVRALIVEGAFAGYRSIAREVLARSWLTWPLQWPLSLTIDNRYRPREAIGEIAPTPVLIIEGADDPIIAPANGEALFAAAGEPKALWLASGGHIAAFRASAMQHRLLTYLMRCAFAAEPDAAACRGLDAAGPAPHA